MSRVTLKDVAKKAGVSISTVSLALRGRGMVSRKTVERLRSIALELGYRPNPMLASLAASRFRESSSYVGVPLACLQFPRLPGGKVGESDYSTTIISQAKALGYAPTLYKMAGNADPAGYFRKLYNETVQGIVIIGCMNMETFGNQFDWSPFSVVQCARFYGGQLFHTVRPDIFQAVKLAFMQLKERGYQRIGFALGSHNPPMEDDEARYGAAIALETVYMSKKDQLPVYRGSIEDLDAFLMWVEKSRPDAVVGFSVSYYWKLKESGYQIPEAMGFAGLHLAHTEQSSCFSGLNQQTDKIARQTILLLDQMIRHREQGITREPLNILVPSAWKEGSTLRPRVL